MAHNVGNQGETRPSGEACRLSRPARLAGWLVVLCFVWLAPFFEHGPNKGPRLSVIDSPVYGNELELASIVGFIVIE